MILLIQLGTKFHALNGTQKFGVVFTGVDLSQASASFSFSCSICIDLTLKVKISMNIVHFIMGKKVRHIYMSVVQTVECETTGCFVNRE